LTPRQKCVNKPLFEKLLFCNFKIITDPFEVCPKIFCEIRSIFFIKHLAHLACLKKNKRKIGNKGIPSPSLKLGMKIINPIGTFQLNAINENRTKITAKTAYFSGNRTGHPVQITLYGFFFIMVQNRA